MDGDDGNTTVEFDVDCRPMVGTLR